MVISVDSNDIKQRHVIALLFSLNKYMAYLLVSVKAKIEWQPPAALRDTSRASSVFKVVDVRIYFYIMSPSQLELTLA